jgi:hypothetical protein
VMKFAQIHIVCQYITMENAIKIDDLGWLPLLLWEYKRCIDRGKCGFVHFIDTKWCIHMNLSNKNDGSIVFKKMVRLQEWCISGKHVRNLRSSKLTLGKPQCANVFLEIIGMHRHSIQFMWVILENHRHSIIHRHLS